MNERALKIGMRTNVRKAEGKGGGNRGGFPYIFYLDNIEISFCCFFRKLKS